MPSGVVMISSIRCPRSDVERAPKVVDGVTDDDWQSYRNWRKTIEEVHRNVFFGVILWRDIVRLPFEEARLR